jgi:trigger factor
MKSSLKKIKDCKVRLTVEVEAERVENRYKEVLRDFQKAANLPGFREGKAPADMVEKRYAKEAEEETVKALIPEAYQQCVVEAKLTPVTLPSISDIKFARGQKLTFAAEFDQEPEFKLKDYKGLKVRKVSSEVEADDLEKAMQSLIESRAELMPLEVMRPVQKGDFIVSDIEVYKDGRYTPGKKGVLLYAEPNEGDDFFEKIVGAQLDEVKEISADVSPEEKAKGIVGRQPFYKVWVRGIKEKKLPALDEAFAKGYGLESVDALREAVKKDLARHKAGDSQAKMKEDLFSKLLKLADFTVPESLVEKQMERLYEQARRQYQQMGAPEDRFEAEKEKMAEEIRAKAAEQVKLYFLLQRVADEEGIGEDEIELEKRLTALAQESKRPMEEVRRVFEDDLRESMREKKTVDFLLEHAKLEDGQS